MEGGSMPALSNLEEALKSEQKVHSVAHVFVLWAWISVNFKLHCRSWNSSEPITRTFWFYGYAAFNVKN